MKDIKNNKFDFFRGSEADQFNFYRIPKILFTDKRFAKVSVEAKVLYGLLLDRMSLSIKNGWVDEENRVYIYFKLEDAMEFMGIGKDKGVKLFAELDLEKGCGLIQKKRQGLGKPTIIYVMNFNSGITEVSDEIESVEDKELPEIQTSENPNSELLDSAEVLTSEKPKSGFPEMQNSGLLKNRSLDFCKSETNNIEINNTDFSDTYPIQSYHSEKYESDEIDKRNNYKKVICDNISYGYLCELYDKEMFDGIIELMVDLICSKRNTLQINCDEIPQRIVKEKLLKLRQEHIEYVLDCLKKNTVKIRNIRSYLITALYNASSTIGHYYTAEVNHDLYGI